MKTEIETVVEEKAIGTDGSMIAHMIGAMMTDQDTMTGHMAVEVAVGMGAVTDEVTDAATAAALEVAMRGRRAWQGREDREEGSIVATTAELRIFSTF